MKDKETRWFVFCSGSLLIHIPTTEGGKHSIPCSQNPPTDIKPWTTIQELPDSADGIPQRAYQITTPASVPDCLFVGLRESYGRLEWADYLMAGKAAELLYWDSGTQYCGVCGAPMKRTTAISKQCTHCGKEVWPQVSPAIIVRIRRRDDKGRDQILMVHARNFRRSEMYGLVAGFVETGETLEQCVEREVLEETHLRIKNICYFASQPWPYPCGIMIGFTADYAGGEIALQAEEISQAGWFSRNELPPIPEKLSIARRLIDDWMSLKEE
jgi:NAD+ diphosphatase